MAGASTVLEVLEQLPQAPAEQVDVAGWVLSVLLMALLKTL
jgi:hypothetical protein